MQKISAQLLDILEQNVKFAIDEVQKEKRQYINKHVQNSLNNYFLENYCVLDLKKRFEIHSGRQIKNIIQDKYSSTSQFNNLNLNFTQEQQISLKKYYILMLGFLEEHIKNDTLNNYREAMLKIVQEDITTSHSLETSSGQPLQWVSPYTFYENDKDKVNKWVQLQWKRLLALFVLHHSYYPHIEAIYQIWFDIFQTRIVDATTQKKKKPENNRPYKYFDLPYLSNNDYYSSQPLVVPITEENTSKFSQRKQKQQYLLQTSNSLLSENGSSRDKTEGTAAESEKQNNCKRQRKQKYQKISKSMMDRVDSSLGEKNQIKNAKKQDKISNTQEEQGEELSDYQVIEKMPYKKVKRQQNLTNNSGISINSSNNCSDLASNTNDQQLINNTISPNTLKEDYRNTQVASIQNLKPQETNEKSQVVNKSLRKESMNSLSKDYFPQQSQSAFQKYNKKIQFQGSDQCKASTDQPNQMINLNNALDSNIKNKSQKQQDQINCNTSSSSPKAIISIIPIHQNNSQSSQLQEINKKQLDKNEDAESSNNQQQEKQNGSDSSTCNPSQNILQSPVSQTPHIPMNAVPINNFSYQLNNMVNTQPAIHFQQQPLQLMFQQYIPQQINQFVHPNQLAAPSQVIPFNYVNNLPIVHLPFNYISMIQPSCTPTSFLNMNQF